MQNKREFWNDNLHLEEIKNIIINIMERKDLDLSLTKNIKLNSLSYEISLNRNVNRLTIVCNDGRNLAIDLNLIGKTNGDDVCLTRGIYKYKVEHEDKEQQLEFTSNPMRILDNLGLTYIDVSNLINVVNYDRYNEYKRLRTIDSLSEHFFIYNYVTAEKIYKYQCLVTPDGYSINIGKDHFLVANDYKLLSINEQEVCDYEKIKEFDYEDELRKIKEIIKQNSETLNPLTILSLNELMISFEKIIKIVELSKLFYEKGIIDELKEAVRDYNKMLEFINNYTFTKEELSQFSDTICKMLDNSSEKEEFSNVKIKALRK